MQALGKKHPLLAYGVPAGIGIAAGGLLAGQGEDPGSIALGGAAAALGARGALGTGRVLAGKYNPELIAAAQKQVTGLGNRLSDAMRNLPETSNVRRAVGNVAADVVAGADARLFGNPNSGRNALIPFPTKNVQGNIAKGLTALAVPTSALAAGLGGVALGAVPGAMGIPGFQEKYIDPEQYGSSNTRGALATTNGSMTTAQYM
jgi:hypothetical protein